MPIRTKCDFSVNSITCDESNYYCTSLCKYEIIKLDKELNILNKYHTCRKYTCICYDYTEKCFWTSTKEYSNRVYKLDIYMNEVDCIVFSYKKATGVITGISYECCNNSLVISYTGSILKLSKKSRRTKELYKSDNCPILGVLSINGWLLVTAFCCNRYKIIVLDNQCREEVEYLIDKSEKIVNLLYCPCINDNCKTSVKGLILKNNCCFCLCCCCIDTSKFRCPYCCDDCECSNNNYNNLIESVALVETSLAHILNAEGEKLQKVIKESDDIDLLLCVNREVNKTIINATFLEQVLYHKLVQTNSCCDEKCVDCCKGLETEISNIFDNKENT